MPVAAPIAVIGMACRFPGGADSPAALWQKLDRGEDVTSRIPVERFDIAAWHDDGSGRGIIPERGGFLSSDIRAFDAGFFGIPPAEAEITDPQFRLLLELGYEALEDAGQPLPRLSGGDHGVYVGICFAEYRERLLAEPGGRALDSFLICGTTACSASGRLSYHFGLEGPSLSLDAACSSSLLAVHLACRDLASGEIDSALAGGVNLMLSPQTFVAFSRLKVLSPDGRCKGFDGRADGYGRAEGAGLVCLKRLADAQRDQDHILAVIEGSGLTNDGAAKGYTAPRPQAQSKAIRKALDAAGLTVDAIDMVEAHGTGTQLGDRVELEGLSALYRDRDPSLPPAVLGAIKGNIGHAEAAAGVASLIKVVLALQAERFPAHRWGSVPNPALTWPPGLRLGTDSVPWPKGARRRRAGINSFGMSGVNLHLIVAEAPDPPAPFGPADTRPLLLALSARSPRALGALVRAWIARLQDASPAETARLVASQAYRRSVFPYRLTAVGPDSATLRAALAVHLADCETVGMSEALEAPRLGILPGTASPEQTEAILTAFRTWGLPAAVTVTRAPGENDQALAARLTSEPIDLLIEISATPFRPRRFQLGSEDEPHPLTWISALAPDTPPALATLAGWGRLHEAGVRLDPARHHPDPGAGWVETPRYPWDRQIYWVEAETAPRSSPTPPRPPPAGPRPAAVSAPPPAARPSPPPPSAVAADPLTLVRESLAAVLGLAAETLDLDAPMAKLGLDSLMALTLASRLSVGRAPLSPTLFWNHPTARRLAGYLATTTAPAGLDAVETELDDLLERLGG